MNFRHVIDQSRERRRILALVKRGERVTTVYDVPRLFELNEPDGYGIVDDADRNLVREHMRKNLFQLL